MALSRLIVQLISNGALTPLWIAASKILAHLPMKIAANDLRLAKWTIW
ncbi:MAG: hypothetical protein ACREDV_06705 [Methylocella sp.]